MNNKESPVAGAKSFEESLGRLQEIVDQLEEGRLSLGESLAAFEDGIKHLKICHDSLTETERKIEILAGFDAAGNPITRPFDDVATTGEENVARRSRAPRSSSARAPAPSPSPAPDRDEVDERRELF